MNLHSTCSSTCGSVLLALASLALVACSAARSGSQNVYTSGAEKTELEAVEGNSTLAHYLKLQNQRKRVLPDGRAQYQVELHNTLDQHLSFAWAVDWFDDQFFKIPDATRHWEPETLGGGGFKVLQLTAPTPQATSYRLQIQSPDEVH